MAETSPKGINKISFRIKQMSYGKDFLIQERNETVLQK